MEIFIILLMEVLAIVLIIVLNIAARKRRQ